MSYTKRAMAGYVLTADGPVLPWELDMVKEAAAATKAAAGAKAVPGW